MKTRTESGTLLIKNRRIVCKGEKCFVLAGLKLNFSEAQSLVLAPVVDCDADLLPSLETPLWKPEKKENRRVAPFKRSIIMTNACHRCGWLIASTAAVVKLK